MSQQENRFHGTNPESKTVRFNGEEEGKVVKWYEDDRIVSTRVFTLRELTRDIGWN